MRCALVDVKNNVITNVIVADPAIDPAPPGLKLAWVPDFVNPRDAWNNGVFVQVVSPVSTGTRFPAPSTESTGA